MHLQFILVLIILIASAGYVIWHIWTLLQRPQTPCRDCPFYNSGNCNSNCKK